jgi:predicted nucleotidyltransferase
MEQINLHTAEILSLYNKYHVKTLRLFGSMVRGEGRTDSDVDLLVTFSKPISLLQMVGLERELSAVLGRKVDLVTAKSVSRYLKNRILKESRQVYAA